MKTQVIYSKGSTLIMGEVSLALDQLNKDHNFNVIGSAAVHIYEKESF